MTEVVPCFWFLIADWVCSQNEANKAPKPITRRMMPGIEKFSTKPTIPTIRNTTPAPPQSKGIFNAGEVSLTRSCCTMVVCVFFLVISSAIRRLSFCLSRISSSVGTPDAKVRFSTSYCCCSLSGKLCTARLCFSTSRSCWACSQASKTLSLGIPEPNNSLSRARHFWLSTGIERSACRCCASLNSSAISIYFCSSSSVGREDLKRSDNILSRSNSSGSIWAVIFAETSPSSLQSWSQ